MLSATKQTLLITSLHSCTSMGDVPSFHFHPLTNVTVCREDKFLKVTVWCKNGSLLWCESKEKRASLRNRLRFSLRQPSEDVQVDSHEYKCTSTTRILKHRIDSSSYWTTHIDIYSLPYLAEQFIEASLPALINTGCECWLRRPCAVNDATTNDELTKLQSLRNNRLLQHNQMIHAWWNR